jgi:glycosyltransferase domain-containing protein
MLTIVIPSYNHEKYILDCLRGAADVDITGKKIVVIDDGSVDATPELVISFVEKNPKSDIEFIKKENSGLVSSLNLALAHVNTEFIYFCASDDIPVPEGVKKCVSLMVDEKKIHFIIGGATKFSNKLDESDVYDGKQEDFLNLPPNERYKKSFFNYPPLLIQSSVFRTQSIRKIGGWDSDLMLDDYPFFIEMLKNYPVNKVDFNYLPEVINVKYRQHSDNSFRNTFRQFKMVSQVIRKLSPESWKSAAIASCASRYILSALNNRRPLDCLSIIWAAGFKSLFRLPIYISFHIFKKIKRL